MGSISEQPVQEKIALIHPNKFIRVAMPLYKKRGKLTSTVRSDWIERLFVLTDIALYWYRLPEDLGGGLLKIGPQALGTGPQALGFEQLGTQQGRVDVRHVVSIKQIELHGQGRPHDVGAGFTEGGDHSHARVGRGRSRSPPPPPQVTTTAGRLRSCRSWGHATSSRSRRCCPSPPRSTCSAATTSSS